MKLFDIDFISSKKINSSLSESEIIFFQKNFLINGVHFITTDNLESSRTTIVNLLISLNYHKNIYCLSEKFDNKESFKIYNIYDFFKKINFKLTKEILFNFFNEIFIADFLWIECSNDSNFLKFIDLFYLKLIEFNIHKNIPIILVTNE